MTGMTDWRGTPIEVGCRVATFGLGKNPQRAVGKVVKANPLTNQVSVLVAERDSSYHRGKHTVLSSGSVLVLTPELLNSQVEDGGQK